MRTTFLAIGLIVAGALLAVLFLVQREVPLPSVAPTVEQICVDAMRRSAPDLSWVAKDREQKIRKREIKTVTLGELPFHNGDLVRVAGVLHAEFEWIGLYPSRAAMEERPWSAPWVTLGPLWTDEPYWRNAKEPLISDRCVLVEGTYAAGAGGHMGVFNGTIGDVLRLDVWSIPYRPFDTTLPPPPPPARISSKDPSSVRKRAP